MAKNIKQIAEGLGAEILGRGIQYRRGFGCSQGSPSTGSSASRPQPKPAWDLSARCGKTPNCWI